MVQLIGSPRCDRGDGGGGRGGDGKRPEGWGSGGVGGGGCDRGDGGGMRGGGEATGEPWSRTVVAQLLSGNSLGYSFTLMYKTIKSLREAKGKVKVVL